MGKHDKQDARFEWVRPEVVEARISYEPPKDEFYKAEIAKLQAENARLREQLHEVQMSVGNYELVIDHQDEMHSGIVGEYKEIIEEKDGEIATLKMKIEMLKEAVVKGALREVLA